MATVRACPVCGQSARNELFRPLVSPGAIVKCKNCDMVYIANIERGDSLIFDGPVIDADQDSSILWSSDLADLQDTWEYAMLPDKEAEWPALEKNAQDALRHIEKMASPQGSTMRILDFGSGWGFFLAAAQKHGWSAVGLEPLPACAAYARAAFGVEVVTDTLHDDTFPPESFNAVTSFQVFEHLPDPLENARILHGLLRKGGVILIEVPNFDTWSMKVLGPRHRHFVQDHVNFFSIDTLSRLLANVGFETVDSYRTTRQMSVRHLVKYWLPKYLPFLAQGGVQRFIASTFLWEMTIGLNIGDIIAVVACKT